MTGSTVSGPLRLSMAPPLKLHLLLPLPQQALPWPPVLQSLRPLMQNIYSKRLPRPMMPFLKPLSTRLLPVPLPPTLTHKCAWKMPLIRRLGSRKQLLLTSQTWSTIMTSQAHSMKLCQMSNHASSKSGLSTSQLFKSSYWSYRRLWRMRPSLNPCSLMHEAKIKKCSLTSISSLTCERSKLLPRLQQKTTTVFHIISSYMILLTRRQSKLLTLMVGALVPVKLWV